MSYEQQYANNQILNMQTYNGRVNIAEPDPTALFRMQEKIAQSNKSTSYYSALAGNSWENNLLAQVFFSQENVQILQNGLRAGVYAMSNNTLVVPPQNVDQLKIIMRSTYLQNAEHRMDQITAEVERLNKMVLDFAVQRVYREAIGYQRYIQDQSTLVMPMDRPVRPDRVYKQLELKPYL
jgi:hypothetical protein